MDIGMVGLGRMGANMVQRLLGGGHRVVAYARTKATVDAIVEHGAEGASSLEDLVARLPTPKVVWLMVPAGAPTQANIDALAALLSAGDIVVDGGNSNYHETMRRAEQLAAHGIHFIDSGTSGGIWGLTEGYCLMVGGPEEAVRHVEPAFLTLAPPGGYAHVGPSGAGHFVKMIHNGIEYGMMAAYGEGFELLQNSRFDLDLHRISQIWQHGSVVRSWLLELAERAFAKDPRLESIRGYVEDSGEGRWTVLEAIDQDVPAPIITLSLMRRFASRQQESFSAKVQAALRAEFGGHAVIYSKQAEQS